MSNLKIGAGLMNQRINTQNTIRTIDRVLQHSKSTLSLYEDSYVEPIQPVREIRRSDQTSDLLKQPPTEKQINQWVLEAKEVMQRVNTQLTFKKHEGTGRILVELVDIESHEVLREIPPEKMLDIIAGIWEWSGLIIDRTE
ncbi:flagellar protein FlaG [Marinilactibacillus psychrotolerans]|uniref:Flagellar protein FlaG n=1 Tax=Marinilactibacillus psychrotolerans TaxID=191770 RepID=A0A5R9C7W6_9LACT|nr:flagellar protein FlaG [Marinilactibacillus psychrotolerans]TLQ09367.1 flagellar protein FlaG [Marinilactibacillus psychrotolerans]